MRPPRCVTVSSLVLVATVARGCAVTDGATQRQHAQSTSPAPLQRENITREAALAAFARLGARVEYTLHILSDGSDPPGRVRSVNFRPGSCTDETLRFVGAFPELEDLELFQQPVSDDGLRHLSGLTNLRWLGLSGTRVTGAGLRYLLRLQRLEALFLEGQSLDRDAFAQISKFEHLRTLRLDRTSLDDARLMQLTPLRELEYLTVFDTAVTAAGAARFNKVLPWVTVHRVAGQEDRPPAPTRPPMDWSQRLVKQTFLWPHNFLSGSVWAGQGLDHLEIMKVLDQRLPSVDAENADKPVLDVIAKTTGRTVVLIPAPSEEQKGRLPTYREALSAGGKPGTVGELFSGMLTMMSEAGGPDRVSMIGQRKPDNGALLLDRPYLIYTLYITREYIAIVALPADGE
jgi:hypothetical protein